MIDNVSYEHRPPKGFLLPNTWGENGEINSRIIAELEQEMALWAKLGYHFKFGLEQEYQTAQIEVKDTSVTGTTGGVSILSKRKLERRREKVIEDFKRQYPHANELLTRQLERMEPEQLLRVELELSCRGATETKFGKFYDERYAGKVMEIPFKPVDPITAVRNFHKVLSEMSRINEEAGVARPVMYKTDFNFSVWSDGTNIMDMQHRDPRALAIMDGLMRFIYDAAPVFMRKHRIDNYISYQNIDTGFVRAASVRQAEGRFEIRLDNNPSAGEHVAATMLMVMKAARFGFMAHGMESEAFGTLPDNHPANDHDNKYKLSHSRFGTKRIFEPIDTKDDRTFYTLEILNGSKINEHGELKPNPKHIYIYGTNRPHLTRELELKEGANVHEWFSKIKIEGTNIIWPPLQDITNNVDSLMSKLANVKYGKQITVIKSQGYTVNADYEKFDGNLVKAHNEYMRNSPNLTTVMESGLVNAMADSLARNNGISRTR